MKQSNRSGRIRKSPALASVALACAIASVSTNAYAFSDGPALVQRAAEFFQTAMRHISEVKQWADQLNHYKQQLVEATNALNPASIAASLQPHPMETATKRALSAGMDRCDLGATGGGLSISGLLSSLDILPSASYIDEQKKICVYTVLVENYKYNDLIDAMQDLKKIKTGGLDKTLGDAKGANRQGQNDTTLTAAVNTVAAIKLHRAKVDYVNKTYDEMLKRLDQNMKYSANKAMNGKEKNLGESLLSAAVSLTTLKATLTALESTCPSGFDCD